VILARGLELLAAGSQPLPGGNRGSHAAARATRARPPFALKRLEQAIRDYLDTYNADPKPFAWSKSADDILASIERFCLRISNSGH